MELAESRFDWARRVALVWLPYAWLVHKFWWLCDDSYISFRYARNWALGRGIRYNLGEHTPVEGYSNFLWMAIAALVEKLGGDVTLWMPLASLVCGTALLAYCFWTLRRYFGADPEVATIATLALGLAPPFFIWSTGGLETMLMALSVFVTYERLVLASGSRAWLGAAMSGLVVALVRIEGIAWVFVLAGVAAVARLSNRESPRLTVGRVTAFLAVVLALWSIYFAWRYHHFGELLSNTTYVKMGTGVEGLKRGAKYLASYVLTYVTPVVYLCGAAVALVHQRARVMSCTLMFLAFPAYAVVTSGDFMTSGRFLVPGLAFGAILFACALQFLSAKWPRRRPALLLVGVAIVLLGGLPAIDVHVVPERIRARFDFRYTYNEYVSEAREWLGMKNRAASWRIRGLALKQIADPGDSTVEDAIGATGYYSDLYIYDRFGLVDREVARKSIGKGGLRLSAGHDRFVPMSHFLKYKPTIIRRRVVSGPRAVGAIKEIVRLWREEDETTRELRDVYGPEFRRVYVGTVEPTYMVVLRSPRPGETVLDLGSRFEDGIKLLGAETRSSADDDDGRDGST